MAERTIVTLGDTLAALVEGKKYTTLRDILVTMNAVAGAVAAAIAPSMSPRLTEFPKTTVTVATKSMVTRACMNTTFKVSLPISFSFGR